MSHDFVYEALEQVNRQVADVGLDGVARHYATAHLVGAFLRGLQTECIGGFVLRTSTESLRATREALKTIGAFEAAGLLKHAHEVLPQAVLDAAGSVRAEYVREHPATTIAVWSGMDELAARITEDLPLLLEGYVLTSTELFGSPLGGA